MSYFVCNFGNEMKVVVLFFWLKNFSKCFMLDKYQELIITHVYTDKISV